MEIFEVYLGDGEHTQFFRTAYAAMAWANTQVINDQYTVVIFDYFGDVIDAMNLKGMQSNRTIILDVRK